MLNPPSLNLLNTQLKHLDLAHTKYFNIYLMLLMFLWTKIALHFTLTAFSTDFFPYFCRYHSTPSLPNNPDTDSNQDIHSNSPQFDSDSLLESFNPQSSLKTIPQLNFNSPQPESDTPFKSFNPRTSPIFIPQSNSISSQPESDTHSKFFKTSSKPLLSPNQIYIFLLLIKSFFLPLL